MQACHKRPREMAMPGNSALGPSGKSLRQAMGLDMFGLDDPRAIVQRGEGFSKPPAQVREEHVLNMLSERILNQPIIPRSVGNALQPMTSSADANFDLEWGCGPDGDWNVFDDEVAEWMDGQQQHQQPLLSHVQPQPPQPMMQQAMMQQPMMQQTDIRMAGIQRVPSHGRDVSSRPMSKQQVEEAIQKRKCNWRKYGQKNLRGKRFQGMDKIRCYYKCNYPGCPVRKQVEKNAAPDQPGDVKVKVTGEHNHEPLNPIGDDTEDSDGKDSNEGSQAQQQSSNTVSSGGSGEGSGAPSDEHDNLSDQETPEVVPHVDVAFVDQLDTRHLNFVIVDPHQPDCPITYASPGFSKLTGYSTEEVVGRNCRFLQGKDTNKNAVMQIKKAISENHAIRIILLNYKKDCSPFWNLLSITPTRDLDGKILSFIGVQIDVSSHFQRKAKPTEPTVDSAPAVATGVEL